MARRKHKEKVSWHGSRQGFFGLDPQSTGNKNKLTELNQAYKLHHRKENNTVKRKPREREKIFSKHIFDKSLISKIYKKLDNSIAGKQIIWF